MNALVASPPTRLLPDKGAGGVRRPVPQPIPLITQGEGSRRSVRGLLEELEEDAVGIAGREEDVALPALAADATRRLDAFGRKDLERTVDGLDLAGDMVQALPPLREEVLEEALIAELARESRA